MSNRVEEILVRGSKILEPLFSRYGFTYIALKQAADNGLL
jgi:hypothetical protein